MDPKKPILQRLSEGGKFHAPMKVNGLTKIEKLPDLKTMETENQKYAKARAVMTDVEAAARQHSIVKRFVETARKFWYDQMEDFLQTRILDIYGEKALPQTQIKYIMPANFIQGSFLSDQDGARGMIAEAVIAVYDVDLYRILYYGTKGELCFEAIPLGLTEEGKAN